MSEKDNIATLHVNGQDYELPIIEGTLGDPVLILRQYPKLVLDIYDPGFMSTASTESKSPSLMVIKVSYYTVDTQLTN